MKNRFTVYNVIAILCGIWFLAFGWVWAWYANVFIAYPFAILGFFMWLAGRKAENKTLNKIAGYILLVGLVVSLGFLVALLIFN
ncbi:MAG TPA: hypothetical protein DGG95_07395 [Cytophagales bacterium]|jgi:hypothetical protein|nr:hypothetical protein [Cytophagales bacterium]